MNVESFNLNHRRVRAPYVRIADRKTLPGGDTLVKYDVRFCQPNVTHLETRTVHAIEHLTAELMRNHTDRLIDFSPMGCRTGFYALMLGVEPAEFMPLLEQTFRDILDARSVPAANTTQCGWGAHHSLAGAKRAVRGFLKHRAEWEQVQIGDDEDEVVPAAERATLSPTASRPDTVASTADQPAVLPTVDTVVLFAMPEELAGLGLGDPEALPVAAVAGPFKFLRVPGLGGGVTWAVVSGIGATNAAAAATAAITTAHPGQLISVGTCGGLGRDVKLGQVVAGSSYTYFDADATAIGYAAGQIPRMPATYPGSPQLLETAAAIGVEGAAVVSGNSFLTTANIEPLLASFPAAQVADMESAAIAQVAYRWDTPFVALRCVSDECVRPGNPEQFDRHVDDASARAAEALKRLLARP